MFLSKYFALESCDKKNLRKIQLFVLGLIVFSLGVVYLSPNVFLFSLLGIETENACPLLTFTRIPCPMCGMGRSFSCLTDFHFAQSFYYNPSGLFLYLLSGVIFSSVLFFSLMKKRIVLTSEAKRLWYLPIVLIVIVWVLNIVWGHH